MTILDASASVLSYILKDLELSNVFKIQLKALKDGIIEKQEAYKTIKDQNERILEADKVKNEFLANISHGYSYDQNIWRFKSKARRIS